MGDGQYHAIQPYSTYNSMSIDFRIEVCGQHFAAGLVIYCNSLGTGRAIEYARQR